ncbi:DUF502 domain-containing protein [Methylocaldum sp.]|uniref:DUF502 domain-containing protein n=1 Tax=Methylocaldum sp. TaxID=1969727 RepID=UPI002D467030|nr:DUF502 domain-containing protein [Methylocaldum sp.]HYE34107.1 DUF502 domain-containing protein [Methylocaldum sp.]
MESKRRRSFANRIQRNILAGLVVLTPILLTWLVFDFILAKLIAFGRPWIPALYKAIYTFSPKLADWMIDGWIDSVIAALITLFLLFLLGWLTSRVIGRQILIGFELLLERIPVLKAIYGSTKRLLSAFQTQPEQIQRVVLISYPTDKMRAVAFVTRIVRDADSGEELAVVYIPHAPNLASGRMEIVPLSQVTPTDWTVEEGMQFVISCGTSTREHLNYSDAHQSVQRDSEVPAKEPSAKSG